MRGFIILVTCLPLCQCVSTPPRQAAKPWPGRCELPEVRVAEHLESPDYQRLLPFHAYVRVARVGPYVEHVTVWYGCVEGNVARFEVSPAGEVTLLSHAWGGVATPPKDVAPVPDEGRVAVERVRSWFGRVAPDAGISLVRYEGAYRDVTLVALEPMDWPGSQERLGAGAYVTFGTDEALTKVVHSSGGWSSRFRILCGRECGEPPKWLALSPAATTLSQMRAAPKDPNGSLLVREALEQLRSSRTVSIDALLADHENVLPPAGLPRASVSLRLFGKGPHAPEPATVIVPIDLDASARGVASGEASVAWASRELRVRARLSIDAPTTDGALHAPLRLEVELDDRRRPSIVLPTRFDGVGVVQRGRFALAVVSPRADTMRGDRSLDADRDLWVSSPSLEVTLE